MSFCMKIYLYTNSCQLGDFQSVRFDLCACANDCQLNYSLVIVAGRWSNSNSKILSKNDFMLLVVLLIIKLYATGVFSNNRLLCQRCAITRVATSPHTPRMIKERFLSLSSISFRYLNTHLGIRDFTSS